jgi:WD40 repeat protein
VTLVHVGTTWKKDFNEYNIRCAAFAPNSRSFVTGQADGTLRWWDCETGGNLHDFGDKSGAITSVAFGRDNQVAAGTSAGAVSVYDLVSGAETRLNVPSYVASVRWSADGSRLAVGLGHYQDGQGAVLIWDPRSTVQPDEYSLARPVGALSWHDGSSLLVADWSGDCQVFEAATGELTPAGKVQKILVSAANWSPDCPLVTRWQAGELAREDLR